MIKEFNNLEEIEKYYDENTNTYVFEEHGEYIDIVVINFDLDVESNIDVNDIIAHDIKCWNIGAFNINAQDIIAHNIRAFDIDAIDIKANNIIAIDINAYNINASDIDANDIMAHDIIAKDINYSAVCFAHNSIKCKSIQGRRKNARHFVLDGKLEVIENDDK